MKQLHHTLKNALITVSLLVLGQNFAFCQGPPPPPDGAGGSPPCFPPPCIPIDGGIEILAIVGVLFFLIWHFKPGFLGKK